MKAKFPAGIWNSLFSPIYCQTMNSKK